MSGSLCHQSCSHSHLHKITLTCILIICTCRSPIKPPIKSCSTQSQIVWSTIRCPELLPDPVCTCLCILTIRTPNMLLFSSEVSLVQTMSPVYFVQSRGTFVLRKTRLYLGFDIITKEKRHHLCSKHVLLVSY